MKKMFPLLLSLLLLTGCASAPAPAAPVEDTPPEEPTIQVTNPWQEFETAEEMAAFVGFDFDVPGEIADGTVSAYRAMENMAEVCYENGLVLRKSEGAGDISGDYNEYPDRHIASTLDESGVVEMLGEADTIHKAIWEMGGYAYALTYEQGMEVHIIAQSIMQIQ